MIITKKCFVILDDLHCVYGTYKNEAVAKMCIKTMFTCKSWLDSELALCYATLDSSNKVVEILEQINVF